MPKPYWLRDSDLIMLEDGCMYFDTRNGAMAAHELRAVADWLEETNAPWLEEVAKHLEALMGEHGRIIDA